MRRTMLSTLISADVKTAVRKHCMTHGVKLGYFVEQAILEQLEDAHDLETYLARRYETTVPLESVLGSSKPPRRTKRAAKR